MSLLELLLVLAVSGLALMAVMHFYAQTSDEQRAKQCTDMAVSVLGQVEALSPEQRINYASYPEQTASYIASQIGSHSLAVESSGFFEYYGDAIEAIPSNASSTSSVINFEYGTTSAATCRSIALMLIGKPGTESVRILDGQGTFIAESFTSTLISGYIASVARACSKTSSRFLVLATTS